MEIEKARELGLCFGVRRAIKLLKEAVSEYGEIETLGPVAHNQQLMQALTKVGIKPIDNLEQVQGKILAVTTHGVSPQVLSQIEARHIKLADTTCPIVLQAQNTAKELADSGFDVIIFGEVEHPEVKGLLGWAANKGIAALEVKQLLAANKATPYRPGIISQTTQSQSAFVEFIIQLIAALPSVIASEAKQSLKEIRIVNTLCQVIQKRQEEALRLAKRSQLMIVIGGHDSANTKRLAEACSPLVETHLVEGASEV
ncbi:MAG: 4-hydroxy-3-methylbut-2-enyl diphosphate reductase, partial [Dehalococcoidia bacterium]|nr:4-hydroxy-3-methylbut-2-enyl diphosphate reductase [Dehalococcoidia bacterium]